MHQLQINSCKKLCNYFDLGIKLHQSKYFTFSPRFLFLLFTKRFGKNQITITVRTSGGFQYHSIYRIHQITFKYPIQKIN
jgi:hypothetical protein